MDAVCRLRMPRTVSTSAGDPPLIALLVLSTSVIVQQRAALALGRLSTNDEIAGTIASAVAFRISLRSCRRRSMCAGGSCARAVGTEP